MAEDLTLSPSNMVTTIIDTGGSIKLTWTNPTVGHWVKTEVYRSKGSFVNTPTDWNAFKVFEGTGEEHTDQNLEELEIFYYVAFGIDGSDNYGALGKAKAWSIVAKDYGYVDMLFFTVTGGI